MYAGKHSVNPRLVRMAARRVPRESVETGPASFQGVQPGMEWAWILLRLDSGASLSRAGASWAMRSTATILLLVLAFGLWAGPHPCHAGASAPAAGMPATSAVKAGAATVISTDAAEASCHGGASHLAAAPARPAHHGGHHAAPVDGPAALSTLAPGSAPASGDCCGGGGAPSRCEQACSSVAVLHAAAPLAMGIALEALPASPAARPPVSLAFPIDHVPLA
jgi:hypothetical protein